MNHAERLEEPIRDQLWSMAVIIDASLTFIIHLLECGVLTFHTEGLKKENDGKCELWR